MEADNFAFDLSHKDRVLKDEIWNDGQRSVPGADPRLWITPVPFGGVGDSGERFAFGGRGSSNRGGQIFQVFRFSSCRPMPCGAAIWGFDHVT